jgi:hypothetical protein
MSWSTSAALGMTVLSFILSTASMTTVDEDNRKIFGCISWITFFGAFIIYQMGDK